MNRAMTALVTTDQLGHPRRPYAIQGVGVEGDHPSSKLVSASARLAQFAEIILRRGHGAETVLEVAAEAPDLPLAQAYAASFHLLADTRFGVEAARMHLRRAKRHLHAATSREGKLVGALDAIAEDRPATAGRLFIELGRSFPDDLFSAYLAQLHCLNHGQFEEMLTLAEFIRRANPQNGFALAMLSFALEQSGRLDEAEDCGLEACSLDPRIPWAHHAIAHVYGTQRRFEDGTRFLTSHAASWSTCGSSMFTHNWWHLMLLRLEQHETLPVLALYDLHIAPQIPISVSSYVNAASMLARLGLHGVDVAERWRPLADEAERRIGEHVLAFVDLHYAMALGRAGRWRASTEFLESVRLHAARAAPESELVWRAVGVPLIEAISAYDRRDWNEATALFEQANPKARLLGGSSAQRELLRLLAADARGRQPTIGGRRDR